ncbi:hypothetical protein BaRGS_00002186 [Batillaria attramentaria]|uniref:Uncharacterized protein n=1 Tax=Batillaria attramentaria TaxID=370345 RepID=A0ABD0M4L4_9CAEN
MYGRQFPGIVRNEPGCQSIPMNVRVKHEFQFGCATVSISRNRWIVPWYPESGTHSCDGTLEPQNKTHDIHLQAYPWASVDSASTALPIHGGKQ